MMQTPLLSSPQLLNARGLPKRFAQNWKCARSKKRRRSAIWPKKAMVDKEYQPQLRSLLDYMEKTGTVRREGSLILLNRRIPNDAQEATIGTQPKPPVRDEADSSDVSLAQKGAVHLSVTINVDLEQIVRWRPDRITAFFAGLAQVLAAQKGDTKLE